jgi:hypothetical protein
MELGHDDLGRTDTLGVHPDGNPSSIVDDGDGALRVNDDLNGVAVAGQVFVDRVVDCFPDQVMKARSVMRIADVHARALPYGLEPFEHLNRVLVVASYSRSLFRDRGICHRALLALKQGTRKD